MSLGRNGDFLRLWSAQTISQFGTQVTILALPLVAILVLEVGVLEVALLGVVQFAPFILVSLPAGVWVDRLRRKPILVVTDLGRAAALGSIPLAIIARITRAAVLDVQNEDYVRTARAKGVGPFLVDTRLILRNALLPISTIIGLQVGLLLSGAVLTETVFAWPGMGTWLVGAIENRDYPVLQGGILFVAIVFVLVNLVVDVSYAVINPRIRVS